MKTLTTYFALFCCVLTTLHSTALINLAHAGNGTDQAQPPSTVEQALIDAVAKLDRFDQYQRERGLSQYRAQHGPKFSKAFAELSNGKHWIDSGAGVGKAAGQYFSDLSKSTFKLNLKRLKKKAFVTLISKDFTYYGNSFLWGKGGRLLPLVDAKMVHVFDGLGTEEIPEQDLVADFGPAHIITDLFGALTYTPFPSRVLQTYFNVLAPDGMIFIAVEVTFGNSKTSLKNHQVDLGNKTINLVEWIHSLPQFQTEEEHATGQSDFNYMTGELRQEGFVYLVLRKTDCKEPIPELILEHVETNKTTPDRFFRLKNSDPVVSPGTSGLLDSR